MPSVRRRRSRGLRRWLREVDRFRRRRPRAAIAWSVVAVVIVCLGWALWSVLQVRGHLDKVEEQARIMRSALVRGDVAGARDALDAYQQAADAADDSTHGVTWSVFTKAPLVGDDASGVALASSVLADLGRDGLVPIMEAGQAVTANTFQPVDHRFPVEKIAQLQGPARRSERAFDDASGRLARVDAARFLPPIRSAFDHLHQLVTDGRAALGSAYRASRLMPRVLSSESARNYLLVMQNNAEARSSGGLPGSLSLIRADHGRVRIVEQVDMAELGASTEPILPLAPEEERLFGSILGTVGVDATLTPDIARAADLIRARWQAHRRQPIDGVVFVDPVMVAYLLDPMGEIPVAGYDPVSAGNVAARVENEIYLATPDAHLQSRYQEAVAKAVFDVFADGRGDTAAIIRALVTGVHEGRLRMHFFDPTTQREIAGTQISGEFVAGPANPPTVGVYVNDAGPTKMQYYLRQEAWLAARRCDGGRQELVLSSTFANDAPDPSTLTDAVTGDSFPGNRTEPGQQLLVIYVSAPVGGVIESVRVGGQDVGTPTTVEYGRREVATISLLLEPDQTETIDVTLRTGENQTGDPRLLITPGSQRGSSNATVPSACRVR